jgi:hypothetical protein
LLAIVCFFWDFREQLNTQPLFESKRHDY